MAIERKHRRKLNAMIILAMLYMILTINSLYQGNIDKGSISIFPMARVNIDIDQRNRSIGADSAQPGSDHNISIFPMVSVNIDLRGQLYGAQSDTNEHNTTTENCFQESTICHILPHQYRDCLINLPMNLEDEMESKECKLPNDYSFQIHKMIGVGTRAQIFLVEFANDDEHYVMKIARMGIYCRHSREEYDVLEQLKEANPSLNAAYLHDELPFYYFRDYPNKDDCICIMFIKQIHDSLSFRNILHDDRSKLRELASQTPPFNILKFVVQCYDQIMNVFEELFALGLLYQDINPANFLKTLDGQCYLIDFGGLLTLDRETLLVGNMWHQRIYSPVQACSPYGLWNLTTPWERADTTKQLRIEYPYLNDSMIINELRQMIRINLKYRWTHLLMMHFFIKYYHFYITHHHKIQKAMGSEFIHGLKGWMTAKIKKPPNPTKMRERWCLRYVTIKMMKYNLMKDDTLDSNYLVPFFDILKIFDINRKYMNWTECDK